MTEPGPVSTPTTDHILLSKAKNRRTNKHVLLSEAKNSYTNNHVLLSEAKNPYTNNHVILSEAKNPYTNNHVILSEAKNPCISSLLVLRPLRHASTRAATIFLALCLLLPIPAHSQGCTQCRETMGQTPARTQSAYRRAITLMTVAGSTVFLASLFALKRFR